MFSVKSYKEQTIKWSRRYPVYVGGSGLGAQEQYYADNRWTPETQI